MNAPNPAVVTHIVEALQCARRLLFITGAGISADSGLPTYRGIGGLYNNQTTEENIPIETALSGSMFASNPAITWKYLHQIEQACRGARFNEAHTIIANMQDHFEVCVLTQNIDGFHRDAGSRNLIEMHGDIHDLYCTQCDYTATVPDYTNLQIPPACPHCKALVRPRVTLFDETLPSDAIQHFYRELDQGFDLVFSIGTTSIFPYIAGPVVQASQTGVPTVEINPGETNVTRYIDHKLTSGAAVSMRQIWAAYQQ
ncbi:MAG: NAD-dependent protein deacylase [Candidatus Contendobacter odensis]|uniref:protein acetyllysine N-acetyltransferase n=1 Tax=Candidatus Contendibacter odensensis TaxID=1400860 RepID=A0A2G6PG51_9GAMM|nr:MAG: NAD-dependent protein deacylase [Candidatus Contendobacter odensis]